MNSERPDIDRMSRDEVIGYMGWNIDSMYNFLRRFVEVRGLNEDFDRYLRERAKEETGEMEP